MSKNPLDMNGLDPDEVGLQSVLGDRFEDLTKAQKKPSKAKKSAAKIAEPTNNGPSKLGRLKACAIRLAVLGCLSAVIVYWQHTGQMLPSAAVPSLLVCAALAGLVVGQNLR